MTTCRRKNGGVEDGMANSSEVFSWMSALRFPLVKGLAANIPE